MDDAQLYGGLNRRDASALSALMDAYAPTVYALCAQILRDVGSPQDIEECASDTFLTAWRRIDQYHPGQAPLRTWVLVLAKYAALDRRRQLMRHAPPLALRAEAAEEPPPDEALADAEERQRLHTALQTLPELERKMIYRRYFLGEPVAAIATAHGLSRQAADNRLWRARQTLRNALGGRWKEVAEHGQGSP